MKLLFISRGRGFGHAVPDIAIGNSLKNLSKWTIVFSSYGSGREAYERAGVPVVDMGLPENVCYTQSIASCCALVSTVKPDVLVTHEEFGALVAAECFGIPSIFLSDWIPPRQMVACESLRFADDIIIFERPGIFPIQYPVKVKPRYIGPFCRSSTAMHRGRRTARTHFGIDPDSLVIVVYPGGLPSERNTPLAPIILPMFDMLKHRSKILYWVCGKDYEYMQQIASPRPDVKVIEYVENLPILLSAADVVITRGTRATTVESAVLGTPSIAISHRTNPMDELLGSRIPSNTILYADAIDSAVLLDYVNRAHSVSGQISSLSVVDEHSVAEILMHSATEIVGHHRRAAL